MNHSRSGLRPMLALTCLPLLVLSAACASTGATIEPGENAYRMSAVPVNASAPAPERMRLARTSEAAPDEVTEFEANVRVRANRPFDVIIEPSVIENEQLLLTLAPSGMMMPVSSAAPMKWAGSIMPRSAMRRIQRSDLMLIETPEGRYVSSVVMVGKAVAGCKARRASAPAVRRANSM